MWDIAATEFVHRLRNYLVLNHIDAKKLSCKPFRAGRATQLMKDGFDIGHVLVQGGWRSVQDTQPYINVDAIDTNRLLGQILEGSDNALE